MVRLRRLADGRALVVDSQVTQQHLRSSAWVRNEEAPLIKHISFHDNTVKKLENYHY